MDPYATPSSQPATSDRRKRDKKAANILLTIALGFFLGAIVCLTLQVLGRSAYPATESLFALFMFFAHVVSAPACFYWARSIGRSPMLGGLLGLFIPIFAYLVYSVLESGTSTVRAKVRTGNTRGLRQCPNCEQYYDPREYRSDLPEVRCSFCRHPISLNE